MESQQPQPTDINCSAPGSEKTHIQILDGRYADKILEFTSKQYSPQNLRELVQKINSENIIQKHHGMIGIRKILSEQKPQIQLIIEAKIVPKIFEFARQQQYPQLQYEAAWALTNVASGNSQQCSIIIENKGIELFVKLLKNSKLDIVEQSIWAVGNISSDCVAYRDQIINEGAVNALVTVIKDNMHNKSFIKHGVWALSNLCRSNPPPKYDKVKSAVVLLSNMLANEQLLTNQCLIDSLWAISYHSDENYKILPIIQTNVVPKLIELMGHPLLSIKVPAIRSVGNIATGQAKYVDQLMKCGSFMNQLYVNLDSPNKKVRRQIAWLLSNIAAGQKYQAQQLIQNDQLITKLLNLLSSDALEVKKQICWIFGNMTEVLSPQTTVQFYGKYNIMHYYVQLLQQKEDKTLTQVTLQSIHKLMGVGQIYKGNVINIFKQTLQSLGGLAVIQQLQTHPNNTVYQKALGILQTFFDLQKDLVEQGIELNHKVSDSSEEQANPIIINSDNAANGGAGPGIQNFQF